MNFLQKIVVLGASWCFAIGAQQKSVCVIGSSDSADGIGSIIYAFKQYMNQEIFTLLTAVDSVDSFLDDDDVSIDDTVVSDEQGGDADIVFYTKPIASFNQRDLRCAENAIKIACSVIEFNQLPDGWSDVINNFFDAVVVPDVWLVDVYKKSGVSVPIFCIPQGILIRDYLSIVSCKKEERPFTFGCVARNYPHKNMLKLLKAFCAEFGADFSVQLKFHVKEDPILNCELFDFVAQTGVLNVEIDEHILSRSEYLEWMAGLDCYVLISKGEGFSITPREAMALGIPCILSNNTAHKTICDSGYVRAIECPYRFSAYYPMTHAYVPGCDFDCDIQEVQKALREVYEQYQLYYARAQQAKSWALQYEWVKIMHYYETMFNPQQVVLGDHNAIEGTILISTSEALVEKYKKCQRK